MDGFGDIGAQARGLNISVWFSGQEIDSFKKGSEIEASRVFANTGIKIFMKTEGGTTSTIARQQGGESYVYAANEVTRHGGVFTDKTIESDRYSVQKVDRVAQKDLVRQKPGESHVFFAGEVWQVDAFYGDFVLSERADMNHFIELKAKTQADGSSILPVSAWVEAANPLTHPDRMPVSLKCHLHERKRSLVVDKIYRKDRSFLSQ